MVHALKQTPQRFALFFLQEQKKKSTTAKKAEALPNKSMCLFGSKEKEEVKHMRTSTANVGGVTLRDGEKLAVAFPHLRNGDSIPLHLIMVKIEGWWWCEGEKRGKGHSMFGCLVIGCPQPSVERRHLQTLLLLRWLQRCLTLAVCRWFRLWVQRRVLSACTSRREQGCRRCR